MNQICFYREIGGVMKNTGMFRFMVPTEYEILKYDGEVTKDIEFGIKTLLEYLPKEQFTEKIVRENLEKYNFDNLLKVIENYFEKEYQYIDHRLEVDNRYQHSVGSYIWFGENEEESHFIHMDELFEAAILSFFLVVFMWSKGFTNLEIYGFCFRYLLFIMNDVSILGKLPDQESSRILLKQVCHDQQIINLAEDCYWTVAAFTIAHEIAHGYIKKKQIKPAETVTELQEEEIEADRIAYDIVLKMIDMERGKDRRGRILEEYTFLAPIMYMDYFDLLYYTDRVLYKMKIDDDSHPFPKKRKEILFSIPYKDQYAFDPKMGNDLYGCFLDVFKEFKEQVLLKMERGKLNKIIRPERWGDGEA